MSNMSQNQQSSNSANQSEDHIPGSRYVKKQRINKRKVAKLKSSTYKKKKCEFYNKGACNKGSQCTFSHSFIPDVAKKICKYFLSNSCTKGEDCKYSHSTKRYPCIFFHIQKHCGQGNECRFSHQEIDPDFQDEFLKDNQEFLVKIYKQDRNLPKKYLNYVQLNDLLQKENKKQNQPSKPPPNLHQIIGLPIPPVNRTVPSNYLTNQQLIPGIKKPQPKKDPYNELPFSIRISHKNRAPIPEKLDNTQNAKDGLKKEQSNVDSEKDESSVQKNELQGNISQKISQAIELTPQSKFHQFYQGIQQYMCTYN